LTSPDDALVDASTAAASAAAAPLSGPPPSSDAPGAFQEPPRQSGSDDEQPEHDDLGPRTFDERHREPFTGLLYLGYLEDDVTIWGHHFRIATPTQREKIQAGALHKPYIDTLASEVAYQTILVGAYLVSIDGQELPRPVTNDPKENGVKDRFNWVADNLKGPVIDRLFDRCMILEVQVGKVLRAMGEAQG